MLFRCGIGLCLIGMSAGFVACSGGGNGDANTNDATSNDAITMQDAADVTSDAPTGTFNAMVSITSLTQSCASPVASDPVSFAGSINVSNSGSIPIGPITVGLGYLTTTSGDLASFSLSNAPVTIPQIAPGSTGTVMLTKMAGTLSPANGCQTVACNTILRVEFAISGAGVPDGARISSELWPMMCTM